MTTRTHLTIGVPTERKDGEQRVVLTPSSVALVTSRGFAVQVQSGAGDRAGYRDIDYQLAGADIVDSATAAWAADLVVKVKEPLPHEYVHFRPGQLLFAFLHLAAEPGLTAALMDGGTDCYAFETLSDRGLPLLAPMSEIAGRAAAIIAANELSSTAGGSGTLVGGAAGVPPARAVVIGMGVAGTLAARGLRGLDAQVTGVDLDLDLLLRRRLDGSVDATQISEPHALDGLISAADIVIGAALVPGARAPVVVTEQLVAGMRPGSVIVDLAIDQGGCVATARPTSLSEPTYVEHGVVHYCVTNVPGQFARTASAALSAAVAPRLIALAEHAVAGRTSVPAGSPYLARIEGAANVVGGRLVHSALVSALPHLAD